MTEADLEVVSTLERDAFEGPTLAEELTRPWARIWVARIGVDAASSRVVGFLLAWHVADELHVLNVATGAGDRRRGVGRALMNFAIEHARASDVRMVLLEVRPSNEPALALYRGLGFEELGVRKNYYPDGENALELVFRIGEAEPPILP